LIEITPSGSSVVIVRDRRLVATTQ
jgi:hypothetical protein